MAVRPNWFVGLPVLANHWFEQMVQGAPEGLTRFNGSDLHLTVAFLGACGEEAALRAWRAAPDWPTGALEVSLGAVVPMGNPQRWSALSVLLEDGREEVEAAIGQCRHLFWEAAGAHLDRRPPKAHVTLARPLHDASAEQRQAALTWAAALDLSRVRVELTSLALYTWSNDRRARQFRILERRAL